MTDRLHIINIKLFLFGVFKDDNLVSGRALHYCRDRTR